MMRRAMEEKYRKGIESAGGEMAAITICLKPLGKVTFEQRPEEGEKAS